jgi:hypothetical protein
VALCHPVVELAGDPQTFGEPLPGLAQVSGNQRGEALIRSSHYASALLAAQLHALAYLPGDLSAVNYSIYTVFFGFDILCVAYLVFRSTFLPEAIGVLLAIEGLAYLAYAFADLLAPGFAAHLVPWDRFARDLW